MSDLPGTRGARALDPLRNHAAYSLGWSEAVQRFEQLLNEIDCTTSTPVDDIIQALRATLHEDIEV